MGTAFIKIAAAGLMILSAAGRSPGQIIYTTNLFPVADTTIRSDDPNGNYGGATYVMSGTSNSNAVVSRGLFKFDVSGIPTNASVSNAAFSVVGINVSVSDYFGLSRVLVNWAESSATWNRSLPSTTWSVPGGNAGVDYSAIDSSYDYAMAPGFTNIFTNDIPGIDAGVIQDVQLWINNPSQNFGWLLHSENEAYGGPEIQVGSRENPGNQPVLTVSYALLFEPPVLRVVPSTNGEFCFIFHMEQGHGYRIYSGGDPVGAHWQIIQVWDPSPIAQDAEFCYPIASTNTFYRIGSSP